MCIRWVVLLIWEHHLHVLERQTPKGVYDILPVILIIKKNIYVVYVFIITIDDKFSEGGGTKFSLEPNLHMLPAYAYLYEENHTFSFPFSYHWEINYGLPRLRTVIVFVNRYTLWWTLSIFL
jgi:hypothetical protein